MSARAQITSDFYEPVVVDPGEIDDKGVIIRGGREEQRHYAVGEIIEGEKAEFFVGKGLAKWVEE